MKNLTTILFLALLFVAHHTQAWSGAGHQVIAAEAYRQLSPALQAKVTEILKSHPDYEKWKESFTGDSANLDLGTFIFLRASTWPDDIRRRNSPYNHPKWHYVDYPLKPGRFPVETGPEPTDDILYGIGQCEKVLADTKTSAEERAVYLSWLIHLVGDIHMPVHGELPFKQRLAVQTIRGSGFASGNSQGWRVEGLGRPLSPRACRRIALGVHASHCKTF
jgi:S1/P1 Nuclease